MTGWLAGTKGRYTYKTTSQLSQETGAHGNKATILYQRTEWHQMALNKSHSGGLVIAGKNMNYVFTAEFNQTLWVAGEM